MKINTFHCVINDWHLDYTTKESWFVQNVGNCQSQPIAEENISCYIFSTLDKETNIPFWGKALFVNQRLKGLELSIQNDNTTNRLQQMVTSMLGDPDVRTKEKGFYFFEKTKYSLIENGKILLIEFHKTYKKSKLHFDSPLKLSKVYRLRGCSRYFGLATLIFLTLGYSYNVYKSVEDWLTTGLDFYLGDSIFGAIFVLPFILWTIRNLLGLYNLEYSCIGKKLKSFCDGTDKEYLYRNLYLLNEELKDVELKDSNIRITKNFVCVRDTLLYVVLPKKNIVNVSYGTVTMRLKMGSVTHTCLEIKAADGAVYKYINRKKERMDEIKAIIK